MVMLLKPKGIGATQRKWISQTQKWCCLRRLPMLLISIMLTITFLSGLRSMQTQTSPIFFKESSQEQSDVIDKYRRLVSSAVTKISSNFSFELCDDLFLPVNQSLSAFEKARQFSYSDDKQQVIFKSPENVRCMLLKSLFGFNESPLSKEEEDYPLAFGALVYRWADEVYYMLSAIYHPQNAYCIAVDGKSEQSFKNSMELLDTCFDNIHVIEVHDVWWCGYGTINAIVETLRWLTKSGNPWKYFQYISGTDLPLKTNREMVRIFKRLNGSFNAEIKEFQKARLGNETVVPPHNITMYKSSMSATFSRPSADFIINDKKAQDIFEFLNGTRCPDESLWTSIAGNPHLGMPNGFDGARFLRWINAYKNHPNNTEIPYYISRYQVWTYKKIDEACKGKVVSSSCAFGVGDLEVLDKRPELIAHKLYLDFEPAAFFCFYKRIRERALRPIELFDDTPYGNLPGPRALRGEPLGSVGLEPAY